MKTGFPWLRLLGSFIGVALLLVYFSDYSLASLLETASRANWWLLAATVPIIVANMTLRSLRWRSVLGSAREVPLPSAFSAQMVGYLANNILPVRLGDLVRVLVLGQKVSISRSRIISTVLLERLLDIGMVVLLLAALASINPLPTWMRTSAALLAAAAAGGMIVVMLVAVLGERGALQWVRKLPLVPHELKVRLETWAAEFAAGINRMRKPVVAPVFFGGTLVIWATEILLILAVAEAFDLHLSVLDAAVLMLFSLFSSFIPALPAQVGTFELAMVMGLKFVGHTEASTLSFVITLHFVLFLGTTLLGVICLLMSDLPLMPKKFLKRLETSQPSEPAGESAEQASVQPSGSHKWGNAVLPSLVGVWVIATFFVVWVMQSGPLYQLAAQELPVLESVQQGLKIYFTRPYVF
jgi:glycosyltransferase 2 family protein